MRDWAKVIAYSRRSKVTILVDKNVETLEEPLTKLGYRVFKLEKGLKDPHIQKLAEGSAMLTKNARDFVYEAIIFDYDVIEIGCIQDEKNITAKNISRAITDSRFYNLKGNFHLKIYDDGHFGLIPI